MIDHVAQRRTVALVDAQAATDQIFRFCVDNTPHPPTTFTGMFLLNNTISSYFSVFMV